MNKKLHIAIHALKRLLKSFGQVYYPERTYMRGPRG